MRNHKRTQVAMIGQYFHSIIQLLEVVTSMTETFNNSKKFSIMNLEISLDVNHFPWEVSHDFLLCLLFLQ